VCSTLSLRKASTVLSFFIAALFLMLTGFVPRDTNAGHVSAVVFVTMAVAGLGLGTPGWDVNALGEWAAASGCRCSCKCSGCVVLGAVAVPASAQAVRCWGLSLFLHALRLRGAWGCGGLLKLR
jgi:hypothetical membrane protein